MGTRAKEPPEVRALLARARKNERVPPRKHHLVPHFYLKAWTRNGQIRVTDVETRRSFTTSPSKAVRVTDFYRLEANELDPKVLPPLLFETMLSEIEGWGKAAITQLLEEPTQLEPELAAKFAWFLGFQFTRGAAHREEVMTISNEFFKLKYLGLSDEGIRQELARRGADPTDTAVRQTRDLFERIAQGELIVAPQQAALVGQSGVNAAEVGEYFLGRAWIVCRTHGVLVTSDEPVVTVGGPGQSRDQRAGIATAGVILFPLAPTHLLVMMREDLAIANGYAPLGTVNTDELGYVETVDVCHELVMNSHRWAFERSDKSLVPRFHVPKKPAAMATEEMGPIQDGNSTGTLIRTYAPNRWAHHPARSMWPVTRWWLNSVAH